MLIRQPLQAMSIFKFGQKSASKRVSLRKYIFLDTCDLVYMQPQATQQFPMEKGSAVTEPEVTGE
jgi:hypothetical protein